MIWVSAIDWQDGLLLGERHLSVAEGEALSAALESHGTEDDR